MSGIPSPSFVRSQRNQFRRPASDQWFELDEIHTTQGRIEQRNQEKGESTGFESINHDSHGRMQIVKAQDHLSYFSTRYVIISRVRSSQVDANQSVCGYSALILNKMVGTGIFVAPSAVLAITGSKGISIVLWLIGGMVSWAG